MDEMQGRDEFAPSVKKVIAERAGHHCSRPECRRPTIGPHSDPTKSTSTGVVAHIRAAKPGGPRFDRNQTHEDRKSIGNAIWLCHGCSDLVDKNEDKYPPELLTAWTREQERWIAQDLEALLLPDITLRTHKGLTLPNYGPAEIQAEDIAAFREHILVFNNTTRRVMRHLSCRIQFPEPVIRANVLEKPAGVSIEFSPDRMNMITHASGKGSVRVTGPLPAAQDFNLGFDLLPVKSQVTMGFLSQVGDSRSSARSGLGLLEHHIVGEFQYQLLGEDQIRKFIVPLNFNHDERLITSEPCEDEGARRYSVRASWP